MISQSFSTLPTDRSIPFSKVVDFHGEHNPRRCYAVLPHPDDAKDPIRVSWRELSGAVNRGAYILNPMSNGSVPSIGTGHVVGIFAMIDTFLYYSIVLAIIRSGNIVSSTCFVKASQLTRKTKPFPLSPRNTVDGVVNLLETTSCHHLIIGGPSLIHDAVSEIHRKMEEKSHPVALIPSPSLEQLYPNLGVEDFDDQFVRTDPASSGGVFFHSSGTTGFPKAIHITERILLDFMNTRRSMIQVHSASSSKRTPYTAAIREVPPTWVVGSLPLPPFHLMSFYSQVLMPLAAGTTATFWAPTSAPPPVPTPENTLVGYKAANCNSLFVVPSFVLNWAQDDSSVEYLSTMDYVVGLAGPLSESSNTLTKRTVHLALRRWTSSLGRR